MSMQEYETEEKMETGSTISVSDMLEDDEEDEGNGELLPEIQGALANALREFEGQYDLSRSPEFMIDLYQCLNRALKACGSPALVNPNYVPGRSKQKKKRPMTGYILFTKEAWKKHKEEVKALKKANPTYKNDSTPQDMLSNIALQWKSLSTSQKKPYLDQATRMNNPGTAEGVAAIAEKKKRAARKKGPLSGYQYFVTVTKCPEDLSASTSQMKYKAQLWSALSEDQKTAFKVQSEDTFWLNNPDLLEEKRQREAEEALKAEERRLSIQNMKFNAPIVKPPKVLRPISASTVTSTSTSTPITSTTTSTPIKSETVVSIPEVSKKPEIKLGAIQRPLIVSKEVMPKSEVVGEVAATEVKPIVKPIIKPVIVVKPAISLKI